MRNTIRFWLAAGGVCGASAIAFAQPLPPVEHFGPPPVERLAPPPAKAATAESKPAPAVPPVPVSIPVPASPPVVTSSLTAIPIVVTGADVTCSTGTTAGGKRTLHEKCTYTPAGNLRAKKIPPGVPTAHGVVVRGTFERQKQLALCEYFVVYLEDFLENTAELNPTGLRHVTGIYKRLDLTDATIKVEPTEAADLDEQRRIAVLDALMKLGADSAVSARIYAGPTRAEGLRFEDIPVIGRSNPIGGFGGGGFGGGGFGGGGFGGFR